MAVDFFDILDVEQLLVRYLQSQGFPWVQPEAADTGGRQRIYAGAENLDAEGINPEGALNTQGDITIPLEGAESSIIRLPCIICWCQDAPAPDPSRELAGVWDAEVFVEVTSDSADSTSGDRTLSSDHRARVKQVWTVLMDDALATNLETFSLTAQCLLPGTKFHAATVAGWRQSWKIDGHAWTSTLRFILRQACILPVTFTD